MYPGVCDFRGLARGFLEECEMPRHLIEPRQAQTAKADTPDGDGLFLRVGPSGATFTFRFTAPNGKRREMGVGACDQSSQATAGASLKRARKKADDARALVASGRDPIEAAKAEKMAQRSDVPTLEAVATAYHRDKIVPTRSPDHAREWLESLRRHLPARMWAGPITLIDSASLLPVIADIVERHPETGGRIRQRLEKVFGRARIMKLIAHNPAAEIRDELPERRKADREHFRVIPYAEVPALIAQLRKVPGRAARAIEFGVLTAARPGETRGATWSEIDFDAAEWRIPGERMKAGEPHTVHLSAPALSILRAQRGIHPEYVFASNMRSASLTDAAMGMVLRRLGVADRTVTHSLCRSTFSTWARETGAGHVDVIEACLAHREADRVAAAYNRAQHFDARRDLLNRWAEFVTSAAGAEPAASGTYDAQRQRVLSMIDTGAADDTIAAALAAEFSLTQARAMREVRSVRHAMGGAE
jgi:integrase